MIKIPVTLLEKIKRAAEAAYPNECCGLLVGNKTGESISLTRTVPSPNTKIDNEDTGHDSFEIDPKIHFDLLREIDGTGEIIIGHYHSHPDKPPTPSKRDIENAYEENHVWLIVGVDKNGRVNDFGAFYLERKNGRINNVKIIEI